MSETTEAPMTREETADLLRRAAWEVERNTNPTELMILAMLLREIADSIDRLRARSRRVPAMTDEQEKER